MTVLLTGAGSWSVKIGHIGGYLNDLLAILGAPATSHATSGAQPGTRVAQLAADYAAGTAEYSVLDGFATSIAQFQTAGLSPVQILSVLGSATTIDMCNVDSPTITSIGQAFQLLCEQAAANTTSVTTLVPAVAGQTAVGSPVGDPTWIFSTVDTYGRTQQYVYPESLTIVVTQDMQSGAIAGQESWTLTGQTGNGGGSSQNRLAYNWLTAGFGSGCSVSGQLVNGGVDNQGGFSNLMVNSDFRAYTNANLPDNMIAVVGTVGTDIINSSLSQAYLTGGGSVEFVGNTLGTDVKTGLSQAFNTPSTTGAGTGGTPAILQAAVANNAQYCMSIFYKLSGASPAVGHLRLSVTDGSNTILADDSTTSLTTNVALSAVADTNWHQLALTFRLPQVLPASVRVRVDISTQLTTGTNVYLANWVTCQMQQLYNGGPYVAGLAGNTNPNASGLAPDSWTFAVTNTTSAASPVDIRTTGASFQKTLWRLFDPANIPAPTTKAPYFTPNNGFVYPSVAYGSSPTVADSVVA